MRKQALATLILSVWGITITTPLYCAEWKTYTRPGSYLLKYPASWLRQLSVKDGSLKLLPPAKAQFEIAIQSGSNPATNTALTPNELLKQICIPEIKKISGVEILEKWKATVGGLDAATALYTFMKKPGGKMRFKSYIFTKDARYYEITFGGKDSSFVDFSDDAEKIINSFKLLK